MIYIAEIRLRCLEIAARAHPSDPCGYYAKALADSCVEYVLPPEPEAAPAPAPVAPGDEIPF